MKDILHFVSYPSMSCIPNMLPETPDDMFKESLYKGRAEETLQWIGKGSSVPVNC